LWTSGGRPPEPAAGTDTDARPPGRAKPAGPSVARRQTVGIDPVGLSPPKGMIGGMASDTVNFSAAVRAVAQEARSLGLAVPGFRSPPGLAGVDRTIRQSRGALIVAIRLRGRPFADVVADVVDGILVANGVPRGRDLGIRRQLLAAVEAVSCRAA